MIIRIPNRWWW